MERAEPTGNAAKRDQGQKSEDRKPTYDGQENPGYVLGSSPQSREA